MDQGEFVRVIKQHEALINNVCYLYFHGQDDIRDARQEIILQLWKSCHTFQHKSKWSTWIYKVALNTVLGLIKRGRKYLYVHSEDLEVDAGVYAFDDDVAYLRHLINCLKELDKAVIILHLEGYTNAEIADMLSLTMTNVSTRMHRIKKHLRKLHITKFYEIR